MEPILRIQAPSDEAGLEDVVATVTRLLRCNGIGEEGEVTLVAALREALKNAVRHGNQSDPKKKIQVTCWIDFEKVILAVQDEGPGFNHRRHVKSGSSEGAVTKARARHAEGRMGGLGILMMLKGYDRVEYNARGNQITLTKFLKPRKGGADAR